MAKLVLFSTLLSLAACSGGQSGDDPTPDAAAQTVDAPVLPTDGPVGTMATVVPCEGATIAGDVWYYEGLGYAGSALNASFPTGAIVQFHDMSDHTADSVRGLFSVSGGQTLCVQFDGLGSYEFACYFHREEVGAIHVVAQ